MCLILVALRLGIALREVVEPPARTTQGRLEMGRDDTIT